MIVMKSECRFCYGNGKIHSDGCNGDPMDSGVDCPECEGTGAVDVDCETGDEVESMRTLQRWAASVSRCGKVIDTGDELHQILGEALATVSRS